MVNGALGPLTAAEARDSMLLWGNLVPHMVVSRLPVLHCLRGIMIHIVLSSLWQRLRLFYMIFNAKTSMVTP